MGLSSSRFRKIWCEFENPKSVSPITWFESGTTTFRTWASDPMNFNSDFEILRFTGFEIWFALFPSSKVSKTGLKFLSSQEHLKIPSGFVCIQTFWTLTWNLYRLIRKSPESKNPECRWRFEKSTCRETRIWQLESCFINFIRLKASVQNTRIFQNSHFVRKSWKLIFQFFLCHNSWIFEVAVDFSCLKT